MLTKRNECFGLGALSCFVYKHNIETNKLRSRNRKKRKKRKKQIREEKVRNEKIRDVLSLGCSFYLLMILLPLAERVQQTISLEFNISKSKSSDFCVNRS